MRWVVAALTAVSTLSSGARTLHAQITGRSLSAIIAAGDAAWTARRFDDALAAYDTVVQTDSGASSRAVYRLGTLLSWRNRLREAASLHRLYVRLEPKDPEGRVGLARVYSYAAQYQKAVATYDSVLAQEHDYRDAAIGRAQTLAWWGRLEEAIGSYRAWIAAHPRDVDAELGLARTLAWEGRLGEATAVYQRLSSTDASVDAEKGLARVAGWNGDLQPSETRWRALTVRTPSDPEVWVGLGQVLRWMGRPFAARDALRQALRVRPEYDEARAQLRWVDAEIRPTAVAVWTHTSDSEQNENDMVTVGAEESEPWRGRVGLTGFYRRVGSPTVRRDESAGGRGSLQWQPADGAATVRGEFGVARLRPESGTEHLLVTGSVGGQARAGSHVRFGASASRSAFDEISTTLRRGLAIESVDGEVAVTLPRRFALSGGVSSGRIAGDSAINARVGANAALRWTVRRGTLVGITARTLAYDHPARGTYFAPQRFQLAEVTAYWERPRDLGWLLALDARLGAQSVRFESAEATTRATQRFAVTGGYRFQPGTEITVILTTASVAGAGSADVADYRYGSLSIGGRLLF